MKKQLFIFLFALIAMNTQARVIWNAKAGLGWMFMDDSEPAFSYKVSFGAECSLGNNFYLFPSVEFAAKDAFDKEYGYDYSKPLEEYYIQVPVMVGYKLRKSTYNINFKLGPYYGFCVSYTESSDFGVDGGVDLEYKRFVVGLDCQYGFDQSSQALYLTLGCRF